MVEGQFGDPVGGGDVEAPCGVGLPERGVERVGAGAADGRVDVGGQHAQAQDRVAVTPCGVDSGDEGEPAIGESAGFVGDQHIDVAEVFDADQPLDQHLELGQLPGSGRQAGAHHRGQQLRGDPDGDRQREQHGVDHWAAQQQVGDQDQHRECQRHLQQQVENRRSPIWKSVSGWRSPARRRSARTAPADRWRTPPRWRCRR